MKLVKRLLLYVLITIVVLGCIGFFASLIWVNYYADNEVGKTPQMREYRFKKTSPDSISLQVEYQWVPLDSISRNLIIAVLASEDKDFYVHNGFSTLKNDDDHSFIPERGQTISQRTASATFLYKKSDSVQSSNSSFLEAYFTILCEYMWTKNRILEVYMNTAPLGHGIYGAEAASQIYFGKTAGLLTREEAAFLAILYMNPTEDVVDFNFPGNDICSKQSAILVQMSMMTQVKIGKTPIDETNIQPHKPIYKRNWRG